MSGMMLAVHSKKTSGDAPELAAALRSYAERVYGESAAEACAEDFSSVAALRAAAASSEGGAEERRDAIAAYVRALGTMDNRFPVGDDPEHCSVKFGWADSFRPNKAARAASLPFELASMLFNLGAAHSQIGLSADRSGAEGVKVACASFQAAAGCFAVLRQDVLPRAGGVKGGLTPDLSPECCALLERLMLSQAQECFFEKASRDGKSPAVCAKLAMQVAAFCEEAAAAITHPSLKDHFDRAWAAHVSSKAACFKAHALLRVAQQLRADENADSSCGKRIAEEIARLMQAQSVLRSAKKQMGARAGASVEALNELDATVTRALEVAQKENEQIYLLRVPDPASLPQITPAALVKGAAAADAIRAKIEPGDDETALFAGIMPESSTKALSKYTMDADNIVRGALAKLNAATDDARTLLATLDLPATLTATFEAPPLEEELAQRVELARSNGGAAGLLDLQQTANAARNECERMLGVATKALEREREEDNAQRAKLGDKWMRAPSDEVGRPLFEKNDNFSANLLAAADADKINEDRVEKTISAAGPFLSLEPGAPSSLPLLEPNMVALGESPAQVAKRLREVIESLEDLAADRSSLEEEIRRVKDGDNVAPKLMASRSSGVQALFEEELQKYEPLSKRADEVAHQAAASLDSLSAAHAMFVESFDIDGWRQAVAAKQSALRNALADFDTARDAMIEGVTFYTTLQEALREHVKRCSEWEQARNAQKQDMLNQITTSLASASLADQLPSPPTAAPVDTQPPTSKSPVSQAQTIAPTAPPMADLLNLDDASPASPVVAAVPPSEPTAAAPVTQPISPTPVVAPAASQSQSQHPQPLQQQSQTQQQQPPPTHQPLPPQQQQQAHYGNYAPQPGYHQQPAPAYQYTQQQPQPYAQQQYQYHQQQYPPQQQYGQPPMPQGYFQQPQYVQQPPSQYGQPPPPQGYYQQPQYAQQPPPQ